MRIFIAGATGVIGRRVVPLLVRRGHRVTAVSRSGAEALRRQGATPVDLDLFDESAVRRASRGHDAVINLATSIPSSDRAFFPWAWRENDRLREHASWNLVRAASAAGAVRFVQESVTLGYADGGADWIDERAEWRPLPHVRSSSEAERAAQHFTSDDRAGVVLRFALFHGPDSRHTLDTIRFARMDIAASFGSADGFISSISTDDAARAVVAALDAPPGVYNVADDEPLPRRDYFRSLAQALGRKTPWMPPAWLAHLSGSVGRSMARSHRIANRRFVEATDWRPSLASMREGWKEVVRTVTREGHR